MTYLFLLYRDESKPKLAGDAAVADMERHWAIMDDAVVRGVLKDASPIEPARASMTVRSSPEGGTMLTDGPFAEAKEALAGYYLMDCATPEEAQEWATRI